MDNANSQSLPATTPPLTPAQVSAVAEKVTPVSMMTNALSTFMADIFEEVRQEDLYIQELRKDILNDLPNMKPSEKIALITSETTNRNDMASKVIAPTMQLMTALQQNELAERKEKMKEQEVRQVSVSNIGQVSAIAPSEVLTGLQALFSLQNVAAPSPRLAPNEADETPFASEEVPSAKPSSPS